MLTTCPKPLLLALERYYTEPFITKTTLVDLWLQYSLCLAQKKKKVLLTECVSWKLRQSGPGFPIFHCNEDAPECAAPGCRPNAGPPVCCYPEGMRSGDWTLSPPQSGHCHTNSTASREKDERWWWKSQTWLCHVHFVVVNVFLL